MGYIAYFFLCVQSYNKKLEYANKFAFCREKGGNVGQMSAFNADAIDKRQILTDGRYGETRACDTLIVLHMNMLRTDATIHQVDLAANMPQKGKSKTGIECRVKEEKHRKYPTLNSQKKPPH